MHKICGCSRGNQTLSTTAVVTNFSDQSPKDQIPLKTQFLKPVAFCLIYAVFYTLPPLLQVETFLYILLCPVIYVLGAWMLRFSL